MAAMNDTGKEGIVGRSLRFCPSLQEFNTDDLILTCPECECFLLYCCSCSSTYEAVPSKPCHHFQIMFTDGACINNGQRGATAGIGIAFGLTDDAKHSIPVDADVDDFPKRTSQRAELLAAIEGLRWLSAVDGANTPLATKAQTKHGPRDPEKAWIIATDSAYVVNGMTEWLPAWKNNNLRTSRNTTPANLDLFLRLDHLLTEEETKQDVHVGFWHIAREYNRVADALAKEAARLAEGV